MADFLAGLWDFLDKIKDFLFNFGDIAEWFFDILP